MMRKIVVLLLAVLSLTATAKPKAKKVVETWPDGTVMDAWFSDTTKVNVNTLGRQYVLTDYGVVAGSPQVQTQQIQAVIDRCAQEGGGVVVVPQGTFLTGALFFKQGTHLYLREAATLKGSDRIIDFPILTTRIEGETCKYFCALINADGLDDFTISGRGT
ncbi:MAG: exopolygalacturonase, partial [Prevotella sp.]|nr:exopolygalacturonase [Prevotella sp.]